MHKVALIGYGYWGGIILPYLKECFEVAHICHRSARDSGIFTPSLIKLLNSDIEAVIIATPIDTHYEIARRALEAGKHVFCEKPLTMKYGESIHLTDIALTNKLQLFTDYTYIYSPGINEAKRVVENGDMGELIFLGMEFKQYGRFNDFNVHWLLSSHMLSMMGMFMPLSNANIKIQDIIPNDSGVITVCGEIMGYINVSRRCQDRTKRIVWHCSKCRIEYDGIKDPALTIELYSDPDGKQQIYYDEKNNLRNAVAAFKNILNGNGDSLTNLKISLAVTKVLEGITCPNPIP